MSMVNADDCRLLDSIGYDLLLGDSDRSLQRALINNLFNGESPYTEEEVQENQIRVNVNKLTGVRMSHDARSQYFNGMMTSERYFTCVTDEGPVHSRDKNSGIVTKEINRMLKNNRQYTYSRTDDIASLVLHGIAPGVWETKFCPIPRAIGPEDALLPARTLLSFNNLPFFYLRRSYTGMELEDITRASKRDPGWNLPFVERCLDWLDRQMTTLVNNNYPETMAYEKWAELRKEQGGMFSIDSCPVIDTFDIYIYREATAKEPAGWLHRIILDSWSNPGFAYTPASGWSYSPPTRRNGRMDSEKKDLDAKRKKSDFLYTSGNKTVGSTWENIIKFQFADLSAVAPKRYHSVRSLGWLTYAQCHLENRLYCKTLEAGFETLMQMFQVNSMDDVQKALKIELSNFIAIDPTIKPISAGERWQPNVGLIEVCNGMNSNLIATNSQSWTSAPTGQKKERETNFQRMADLQQVNALVSAGLAMAYGDYKWEAKEIFRRCCLPGERDPLVRGVREACYRQGVPEKLLDMPEAWDIQPERMMGGGNQTLEMMIAEKLLELMPKMEPEPQRIVLRRAVQAFSKDPALAQELVPENPVKVTSATHDAEFTAATLLQGIPVEPLTGINQIEFTIQLLKILGMRVQKGMQAGGMVDPKELQGLQAIAQTIQQHIQIIAQDEEQKDLVKKLEVALNQIVNQIKAFAQRLQEAAKKQAQAQAQQNGSNPEAAAKVREIVLTGAMKRDQKAKSDAQKLAQNQLKFEQQTRQDMVRHHVELTKMDLEAAANIRRGMFDDDNESKSESIE